MNNLVAIAVVSVLWYLIGSFADCYTTNKAVNLFGINAENNILMRKYMKKLGTGVSVLMVPKIINILVAYVWTRWMASNKCLLLFSAVMVAAGMTFALIGVLNKKRIEKKTKQVWVVCPGEGVFSDEE